MSNHNRFSVLSDHVDATLEEVQVAAARTQASAPPAERAPENVTDTTTVEAEECLVCFDDLPPHGKPGCAVPVGRCNHLVCRSCIRQYVTVALSGMSMASEWPFVCPVHGCGEHFSHTVLRRVLRRSTPAIERWSIRLALRGERVAACNTDRCHNKVIIDTDSACDFRCSRCCATTSIAAKASPELMVTLPSGCRLCPDCGTPSMKAGGCPRVRCASCGCKWDWSHGTLVQTETSMEVFVPKPRSWVEVARAHLLLAAGFGLAAFSWSMRANAFVAWPVGQLGLFLIMESKSRGESPISSHCALNLAAAVFALFVLGGTNVVEWGLTSLGTKIPLLSSVTGWSGWLVHYSGRLASAAVSGFGGLLVTAEIWPWLYNRLVGT